MMSKIVLVETVSTFRHIYAVELIDDVPDDYALDSVVNLACGGESTLEEFAQQHVAEDIFSHRVVSEEEYLKMFDEMNPYFIEWSDEQKKKFIYKEV
jgi:hypothetical protein